MTAVFKRELRSFYTSVTGYVAAAFLLLFSGIFTMAICLKNGYPNFEYVLSNMSFIFMLLVPMLTMRTIAEERHQKTDQLLYSLPINMTGVVLGKFFAMAAVLAIPTVIMCVYPALLTAFGAVSLKAAYGSILAFFLLGAALVSIGFFVSSMTENQIVAAVLCFIVLLLNYYLSALSSFVSSAAASSYLALAIVMLIIGAIIWLMTQNSVAAMTATLVGEGAMLILYILKKSIYTGLFGDIMSALCIFKRFYNFNSGIFDVTSIVYFLTVTAVFLFLTVQSLEKRRWS
jgi:ABC-2 type transport system permease protein